MKVFARQSASYRVGMAVLLAALVGGNVVVIRHRLRQEAAQQPHIAVMPPRAPQARPGPAAQLVGGARTQGPFTLAALTRPPLEALSPPPGIAALSGVSSLLRAEGDGTGVWVRTAGGIGIKTFAVPPALGRCVFPVGAATLVVTRLGTPPPPAPRPPTLLDRLWQWIRGGHSAVPRANSSSWSTQWCRADGVTPLPEAEQPYEADVEYSAAVAGKPASSTLQLVPCRLSDRYAVSAQALTARGLPLGGPVTLLCQPVNADTFFAFLPAGYSPRTAAFDLTVARRGPAPTPAHWRLSSLPPPAPGTPAVTPLRPRQAAGPLTVEAAATEAPDLGGTPDWWNRHPDRRAGYWTLSAPQNVDGHQWTGVPTVRCVVRAGGAQAGQEWEVDVADAVPEWRPAPLPNAPRPITAGAGPPVRAIFGVTPPYPGRPAPGWSQADLSCGAAYPGQQRVVRVDGEAVRHVTSQDTLTFKNATVQRDAASGGWHIVWARAQTLTTPGGISVVVLNPRPGAAPAAGSGRPWLGGPGADLWLAWRQPPSSGAAAQVSPPTVLPPLQAFPPGFPNQAPGWDQVWMPGAPPPVPRIDSLGHPRPPRLSTTPLGGLAAQGYQIIHLQVSGPAAPRALPGPLITAQGVLIPQPPPQSPLPPVLPALTVGLTRLAVAERHPIHLVVPVQAHWPVGWDPDAAGSRYHTFP